MKRASRPDAPGTHSGSGQIEQRESQVPGTRPELAPSVWLPQTNPELLPGPEARRKVHRCSTLFIRRPGRLPAGAGTTPITIHAGGSGPADVSTRDGLALGAGAGPRPSYTSQRCVPGLVPRHELLARLRCRTGAEADACLRAGGLGQVDASQRVAKPAPEETRRFSWAIHSITATVIPSASGVT